MSELGAYDQSLRDAAALTPNQDHAASLVEAADYYKLLEAEVMVLRNQRMAPERERELLEASNRHLQAERDISRAYLRLRSMIPGALDTPHAPTPEQVWEITEAALAERLLAARQSELDPWVDRCAWIATQMLLATDMASSRGKRDALGTSLDHQVWMLQELAAKRVGSGTKSCRWLGWAQCALVFKNLLGLEQCKELNLASRDVVSKTEAEPLRLQEGLFLAPIDGTIVSAGEFEGVPAVFIEPTDAPKTPGTYAERQGGSVGLKPGSLIFTCSNHVSGEVLLTYVLRMLGKMEVERSDDSEGFAIEAACHYGFEGVQDVEGFYVANNAQIIALVKAARLQGHHDATGGSFQDRNLQWTETTFSDDPTDLEERRDRFGEEAMELLQATGMSQQAAYQLVQYVWTRPVGEPAQEMGGTLVTLAGLASFAGLDMQKCGEDEMARCNTPEVIAKIRAKRASRVKGSVLPGTEKVYTAAPEVRRTISG